MEHTGIDVLTGCGIFPLFLKEKNIRCDNMTTLLTFTFLLVHSFFSLCVSF